MTLELHETAAIRAVLRDEWDALQPRLIAIAQRVVRRREVAEDVVSATVIELIGRVDAGEQIRDPGAYLARGVRFRAIDVVRSKDGQAVVGSEVADDALASIADTRLGAMAVDDLDALAPVREAFGALSERHREVLARTVLDDEPVQDVARIMGLSPNATAVLALRARRALRSELQAVLMERAGGACAVHARSKGRAALAHVARCEHCLEVRGGRGFGRWVFAVLPLLVGGGAVAVSPANVAQAVVGSIARKPAVAAFSTLGAAAAATVVVVASVAVLSPTDAATVAAPPSSTQAPSTSTQPTAASAADAAPEPADAPAPVVVPVPQDAPVVPDAARAEPVGAPEPSPAATAPESPIGEPAPTVVTPPAEPEPPVTEPEAPVERLDPEAPVDPVEPVDPVDPVDPVEPVDPVDPVEPVDPVDPVDPIDPAPPTPTLTLSAPPTWSSSLPLVASATFTIGGLVPGATYGLEAPTGLIADTVVAGMTCANGSCIADGETATFTVHAVDLLTLCTAAQIVVLTPQTTGQTPIAVTVPPLTGLLCPAPVP